MPRECGRYKATESRGAMPPPTFNSGGGGICPPALPTLSPLMQPLTVLPERSECMCPDVQSGVTIVTPIRNDPGRVRSPHANVWASSSQITSPRERRPE